MEGLKDLMIQHPKKDWLAKVTKSDQDADLRYLLENEEFDAEAIDICLWQALSNLAPKCLDIVVKFAKRKNVPIFLATPYHSLFSVIDSGRRYPENKLVECTRVLIDNGFDVHEPGGWYPLYTLVQQAMRTKFKEERMAVVYESLSLLLAAGADPNFRYDSGDRFLKTQSASTALVRCFGFFSPPSNFHDHCKYFAKYAELFVNYGCDVSEKNNMGTSLLETHFQTYSWNFGYFCYVYEKEDVSAISPYLYNTAGCLIYGGADLNFRNRHLFLPLTQFTLDVADGIYMYFHGKSGTLSNKELSKLNDIATALLDSALSFLKFMNIREAQEILKQSLEMTVLYKHDGKLTNFRTLFKYIFLKHFSSFFSLQTLCMVKVWRCAGKRFTEIGLPTKLVDDIRDMLHVTF